jgi:hypothetical protein
VWRDAQPALQDEADAKKACEWKHVATTGLQSVARVERELSIRELRAPSAKFGVKPRTDIDK